MRRRLRDESLFSIQDGEERAYVHCEQVSNNLAAYSFADSLLVSTQYVARNKKPSGKQTYWEVDGYQLSGQSKKG